MAKNHNPVIFALRNRNPSLALHFVQMGENVNATDDDGDTALMMAVGYKEVFQAIIEKKPDFGAVNDEGETVLHVIALHGSVDELTYIAELISKPGEIDRQNKDGNTPLFLAVSNNGVFEKLIYFNANLYLKNNNRETILHRIAEIGTAADLAYYQSISSTSIAEISGEIPRSI